MTSLQRASPTFDVRSGEADDAVPLPFITPYLGQRPSRHAEGPVARIAIITRKTTAFETNGVMNHTRFQTIVAVAKH